MTNKIGQTFGLNNKDKNLKDLIKDAFQEVQKTLEYEGNDEKDKLFAQNLLAKVNEDPKLIFVTLIAEGQGSFLKQILDFFIEKAPNNIKEYLNQQDENGDTALHWFVSENLVKHNNLFSQLLDHGADPTIVDNQGETALDKAIDGFNLYDNILKNKFNPEYDSQRSWFYTKIKILEQRNAPTNREKPNIGTYSIRP